MILRRFFCIIRKIQGGGYGCRDKVNKNSRKGFKIVEKSGIIIEIQIEAILRLGEYLNKKKAGEDRLWKQIIYFIVSGTGI